MRRLVIWMHSRQTGCRQTKVPNCGRWCEKVQLNVGSEVIHFCNHPSHLFPQAIQQQPENGIRDAPMKILVSFISRWSCQRIIIVHIHVNRNDIQSHGSRCGRGPPRSVGKAAMLLPRIYLPQYALGASVFRQIPVTWVKNEYTYTHIHTK
jgi:hypothetical protein